MEGGRKVAHPSSLEVSALDCEVVYDPVEYGPVIEALLCELHEVAGAIGMSSCIWTLMFPMFVCRTTCVAMLGESEWII